MTLNFSGLLSLAGILLAGCYSFFSTKLISLEDAIVWCQKHDLIATSPKGDSDAAKCLNHILEASVKRDGGITRTIYEILKDIEQCPDDKSLIALLLRHGMDYREKKLGADT
ncbi:MAG: hypothetical protein P8P30_07755 [Rickettsiales bacterium]|nr:hypothetical protein [Rickettsiales bacterium]